MVNSVDPFHDGPRLLADIGATHARFALESAPGVIGAVAVLQSEDFAGIEPLIRHYLARQGEPLIQHAAIAIAYPVDGDVARMTNRNWQFSIEALRQSLGLQTLLVVNDFTALAMALPKLSAEQRRQIGGGMPRESAVIGLLGPGTGLGVSGLIPMADRWVTLGSEGGHVSFAPADERELCVLQYAWRKYPHVSAERLVSGPGLELCHAALAEAAGQPGGLTAPEIGARALAGSDALCVEALTCFCAMLGTVAADLAVTLGAFGGIYIGGGIVPRLGEFLDRSPFRARFEAKGRMSAYLAQVPTYVITAEHPAFLGVAAILADRLRDHDRHDALLPSLRKRRAMLSPAERRVADLVLRHPRAALNDSVGELARQAGVSQPTVIRFCRSLGFEGLSDFRLRLATGLTGTVPVRHSQVRHGDTAPDIFAKVLDNTVSAILRFRESLNAAPIDAAIAVLREARRIEFYGMGNSGIVAHDGQHKFFRLRIPSVAYPDAYTTRMAAQLLSPGDVVVVVSSRGQLPELLEAVDSALARGAKVIAITASHSTLAQRATVCIPVDHVEDSPNAIAMISRILHLLVIDVLAVGVALGKEELASLIDFVDSGRDPAVELGPSRISHLS